ncbi:hypothetical protein LVJ94_26380 [Pendulispora rubella]|uniref:Uncharacterized protein n=1 Tax=Pendulispora rubella TaxID=2741070 RepID=A0ABZ2KP63_9BACT
MSNELNVAAINPSSEDLQNTSHDDNVEGGFDPDNLMLDFFGVPETESSSD